MRLVLATANPDKAAELGAILDEELDDLVELVARPQGVGAVEETGESLEDNARLKAVALVAATGEAAVADDTGLEVTALGGAPGPLCRGGRHLRRQRRQVARRSRGRDRPAGALSYRRGLSLSRRHRDHRRGCRRRGDRAGPARCRGLWLRLGVRAGGRRRAHVCGDEPSRETRAFTPGSRAPLLRGVPQAKHPSRADFLVAATNLVSRRATSRGHRCRKQGEPARDRPSSDPRERARGGACRRRSAAGRRSRARPNRTRPWLPPLPDCRDPCRTP